MNTKRNTQRNRVGCPIGIQEIPFNLDVNKPQQQFFGYGHAKNEFKVATLKNELMYRPTNKFNINDSLRSHYVATQSKVVDPNVRENPILPTGVQIEKLKLANNGSDSTTDPVTILSGRSHYSHAMEQNSLFQLRDNDSIEQYIAQITEREKFDSDHYQPTAVSGPVTNGLPDENAPHLSAEQAMHYTIKCNNLAQWSIDSSSVKVKTINFNIIQTILYRESTILRLKEVMGLLDKCYWKYCVHRIREFSQHQSLHSENLVLRRNQIFALQNEVSVGIAHFRSLTMGLVELVQKLRGYIDKELQMSVSISIFWKDINYMLKMAEDCSFIFEYPSSRYWLGFHPNCLMVPPKDHNPYELWQKQSSDLLNTFLATRNEKKQISKLSASKLAKGKKITTSDVKKTNHTEAAFNNNLMNPTQCKYDTADGSVTYSQPDESSTWGYSNVIADWEQLREYCSFSWTRVEIEQWPDHYHAIIDQSSSSSSEHTNVSVVQSANVNPGFWCNPDHNPLVVEAALGFAEVFPSIYLVPPLPNQLLLSCLRLQEVLLSEHSKKRELEGLQQISVHNKEVCQSKHQAYMDEDSSIQFINQWAKLKQRQQGTHSSLQGLAVDHVSCCLDSVSSRVLEKSLQGSVYDHLSNSNDSSDWHFFLTSQEDKSHSLHDDNTRCASIESFRSTQLVDQNAFKYFRLENCSAEYRKRIEEKINDFRRVVQRNSSGLPLMRQSRKGIREVSRLHEKWIFMHAVSIQKICRGHLARLRVKSMRAQWHWRKAIVKMQTLCRGFLARRRFRKLQHQYKIDTFLLRKGAVKRFRAAILITKFVRNAVHRIRLSKESPITANHEPKVSRKFTIRTIPSIAVNPTFEAMLSETDDACAPCSETTSLIDEISSTGDSDKYQSNHSFDDGSFSISDLNFDDVEKRKFELMQAKALIKRVNEGKNRRDSRRSSRLIPSRELETTFAKVQVKQFSKKQHSLFDVGNDLKSAVSTTNDVFLSPFDNKKRFEAQTGEHDDCSSSSSKLSSIVSSRHGLPPLACPDSRSSSVTRLSFADHLTLKELKRRQKEVKEAEQIRSVLHKFFSE